ncbi:hypothetical protein [Chloroflexus sp.]|uniref:hypothetical protein n=1 Tax=Chloroflexus sp. TaxID=1904827 RepID=UPI002ACE3D08|nr:hypothetical protein [Chloroflexus sp.]MCX7859932.1 hypothetical protein [Chloroflexus sp.]
MPLSFAAARASGALCGCCRLSRSTPSALITVASPATATAGDNPGSPRDSQAHSQAPNLPVSHHHRLAGLSPRLLLFLINVSYLNVAAVYHSRRRVSIRRSGCYNERISYSQKGDTNVSDRRRAR